MTELQTYQTFQWNYEKKFGMYHYSSLYVLVSTINYTEENPKLVSCILTRAVFFRALFKDENTDAKDLLKRKKESLQQISQKLTSLKA